MDRKYIDDHHVVARYLADQLSESERDAFETYFVEDPEVMKDLEAAARFKAGLMQLRDGGELDGLLQSSPRTPQKRAAIAALVAGAALAVSYFLIPDDSPLPIVASRVDALGYSSESIIDSNSHVIVRTRGRADAEIELPEQAAPVRLRILPEFAAHPPRYRISLLRLAADDAPRPIAEIQGVSADDDGFITIYLRSAEVAAGLYQLEVAGAQDTDAADRKSTFTLSMR